MSNEKAIGIDLGTTYSCVGVWRNKKVDIIPNENGHRTTPSVVSFTDKERLIGEPAKSKVTSNYANTVYDAKRLIGRRFKDPIVQEDMKHWPFKIVECPKTGKPQICVQYLKETKKFYAEEISAMILSKLKQNACDYLGLKKDATVDAIVTVPAYFSDSQRQSTKDAGKIAGLNVLRIINEPTAAAVAYGLEHKDDNTEKNILIFDLGGGTFDVSILNLNGTLFEVKSTCGDTHLGGEDFDNVLCNMCCNAFKEESGYDLRENMKEDKCQKAYRRLKIACENAKKNLSNAVETNIDLDALYKDTDFSITITRPEFESNCTELFNRCKAPLETALKDAGLSKDQISDIVLVGGSTRIPKIQAIVKEFFGKDVLNKQIHADEAVAMGAAIQAAIANNLDEEEEDGLERLVLLDVTPLSLGTDVRDDEMDIIVPKNTTIPCKNTKTYVTSFDDQKNMSVKICQGERKFCKDNLLLGNFSLPLKLRGKKGTVKAEITFEIDINSILTVTAVESSKDGNSQQIKIDSLKDRLNEDQIQKLMEEAKKYEEYDNKRKEAVNAKSKLMQYIIDLQNKYPNNKKLMDKCKEIKSWATKNPEMEKEDYDSKYRELGKLV